MSFTASSLSHQNTRSSNFCVAKRSKGQVRVATCKAVSAPAVIPILLSQSILLLSVLSWFHVALHALPHVRQSLLLAILSVRLQKPQPSVGSANGTNKSRIAVLGASGYTGEEVIRLMALHPSFAATVLTGESQAGKVRACQTYSSSCGIQSHLTPRMFRLQTPCTPCIT